MALVGASLVYLGFWMAALVPIGRDPNATDAFHRLWATRFYFAGVFLPVGFGYWAKRAAKDALHRGVLNEVWSEDRIARIHRQLMRSRWKSLCLGIAFPAIVYAFFLIFRHVNSGRGGYVILVNTPLYTLMALRTTFQPPHDPGGLGGSEPKKPLVSDHWGEARTSSSLL